MWSETLDTRDKAPVPIDMGTPHTMVLFGRTPNGEYEESWRESYSSQFRNLEIDAEIGNIVYQRTTSPVSGETLERYGMVRGDRHVDWGSDADWIVDFGPMGDVTRRGLCSPPSHFRAMRERILAPTGEEAVRGVVEETDHTSGSGSG